MTAVYELKLNYSITSKNGNEIFGSESKRNDRKSLFSFLFNRMTDQQNQNNAGLERRQLCGKYSSVATGIQMTLLEKFVTVVSIASIRLSTTKKYFESKLNHLSVIK